MDVAVAAAQLRDYFAGHVAVCASEPGGMTVVLEGADSGFDLDTAHDKLVLHLWTAERSLVRRVLAVTAERSALTLQCLRFGQRHATPLYLAPAANAARREGASAEFLARLRTRLQHTWPEARLVPGVAGTELPESRHPCFLFRRGAQYAACVAAAPEAPQAVLDAALTRLVLWSDSLASRLPGGVLNARRVVLPAGRHATTRARMSCLRAGRGWELFEYAVGRQSDGPGELTRVEIHDGNLESRLRRALHPDPELPLECAALLDRLRQCCPDIVPQWDAEGLIHFRLHGLVCARQARLHESLLAPFVHAAGRGAGAETTAPLTAAAWPAFERWLRRLAQQRRPDAKQRGFWYRLRPEDWMEEVLRRDLGQVEPACDPRHVYAQVPVCTGAQRDVLDLLAVRRDGVLCVMELKAEENVGFPLQGLDYWLRVRHHQRAGDFERLGYFPGVRLSPAPPELYLVAPALRWHPRADVLLRAIAPEVPVRRLGVNEEWRRGMHVVELRQG